MAESRQRYEELKAENERLLLEKDSTAKETYEVAEYLRKQLEDRNERIANLEAQLAEVRSTNLSRATASSQNFNHSSASYLVT